MPLAVVVIVAVDIRFCGDECVEGEWEINETFLLS